MDGQSFPGTRSCVWRWRYCFGEPFKLFPGGLYEGHVLVLFGVSVWYTHFILVELNLTILDVENLVSVLTVIGDAEPLTFKFWGAEDVRNLFLVDPTLNGTKMSLLVGGSGPCIEILKQPSVIFPHFC